MRREFYLSLDSDTYGARVCKVYLARCASITGDRDDPNNSKFANRYILQQPTLSMPSRVEATTKRNRCSSPVDRHHHVLASF